MPTCIICGQNLGPHQRGSKPVIGCKRPECRQEIRRLAGLKSAAKVKAKATYTRTCLRCDKVFRTRHKYHRICGYCHGLEQHETTGAEWWGFIPI
jgi:hypothetical protein